MARLRGFAQPLACRERGTVNPGNQVEHGLAGRALLRGVLGLKVGGLVAPAQVSADDPSDTWRSVVCAATLLMATLPWPVTLHRPPKLGPERPAGIVPSEAGGLARDPAAD